MTRCLFDSSPSVCVVYLIMTITVIIEIFQSTADRWRICVFYWLQTLWSKSVASSDCQYHLSDFWFACLRRLDGRLRSGSRRRCFRAFPVHSDQSRIHDWRPVGHQPQPPGARRAPLSPCSAPLRSGGIFAWMRPGGGRGLPAYITSMDLASRPADRFAGSFLNARLQINHRISWRRRLAGPPRGVQKVRRDAESGWYSNIATSVQTVQSVLLLSA